MGRRAQHSSRFEQWRTRFLNELAAEFDEGFATEAAVVLDDETAVEENLDRDRALLEAIVPGRALADRRRRGEPWVAHG